MLLVVVALMGALTLSVGAATAQPAASSTPPAAADVQPGPGNDGLVVGHGPRPSTEDILAKVRRVQPRTPTDKLCTGWWLHPVSNVNFQRGLGGTLAWAFKLTGAAQDQLGWLVDVSMPYAAVNDRAINPPYQSHVLWSWYNFHGSLNNYQLLGGGNGTIATGDKVTLLWAIEGVSGSWAYRYTTCQVPAPGSA
ncbi:hypothetical protein [Streptomyces sp. NPDC050485]|uniref:hypothetical protein n=1 Tax=Streptomyces sp. NPDC050485 TaxID=3365617 RepID=UPI00379BACFC